TGADIQGIPYSYNGRVVVAGSTGSRYSTDITTLWQEIGGAQPNPQCLSGGPHGWQTHLHQGGFWTAELVATEWTAGDPGTVVWSNSYAGGYYWISAGGTLRRAEFPEGPWSNHAFGPFYTWSDIVEYDGALWSAGRLGSGDSGAWQIRRSTDDGVTWPEIIL